MASSLLHFMQSHLPTLYFVPAVLIRMVSGEGTGAGGFGVPELETGSSSCCCAGAATATAAIMARLCCRLLTSVWPAQVYS